MLAMVMASMCTAVAWADEGGDKYDPNAKILTVEWTDDSSVSHSVDVTEEMVQGKIWTGKQGVLFCKDGIWRVIGTNRWVSLTNMLRAAGAYDSVTINTYLELWTYEDGSTEPTKYTKYYPYYNEMSEKGYPLYFFQSTTRNELIQDIVKPRTVETCIALNCTTTEIAVGSTAGATLDGMTSFETLRAPRLLWGLHYDDEETGGNRFPSNIAKIVLREGVPSAE